MDKNIVCKKVKYSSEAFALSDIDRINKISTRIKKPIRVYFCKCQSWHLTSKIDVKDIKISELEAEIEFLKNQNQKEEKLQLKINEKVKELNVAMVRKNELIKKLRKESSELITKMIALEKKLFNKK